MRNGKIQRRKEEGDMRIHISHTIQEIIPSKWVELTGTENLEQSYQWFRTVED